MTHNSRKKAIIIGCGVAGPSVALSLKKVGIESEIYEESEKLHHFGILSLAANGINILKFLGVFNQIKINDSVKVFFYKHNGKLFKKLNLGEELKKKNGYGQIIIRRENLIKILSNEVHQNKIPIAFGKSLIKIEENGEKIKAVFKDGTETEGDFLIGCDGMFSKTREIVFPKAPKPCYSGTVWVGANLDNSFQHYLSKNAFHMTLGKKAYFGSVVSIEDKITWWSNVPVSEESLQNNFQKISEEQLTKKLVDLHAEDNKIIQDFIKSTKEKYTKIPIYDLFHLPTWNKGLACLIEDAAHGISPYMGQGASLAMEDSIILAKCLRDIPNLHSAFGTFEKLRKNRVEKIIKLSKQNGRTLTTSNRAKQILRNFILSLILNMSTIKKQNWIFSYKIDWDEKIKCIEP